MPIALMLLCISQVVTSGTCWAPTVVRWESAGRLIVNGSLRIEVNVLTFYNAHQEVIIMISEVINRVYLCCLQFGITENVAELLCQVSKYQESN